MVILSVLKRHPNIIVTYCITYVWLVANVYIHNPDCCGVSADGSGVVGGSFCDCCDGGDVDIGNDSYWAGAGSLNAPLKRFRFCFHKRHYKTSARYNWKLDGVGPVDNRPSTD